MRLARRSRSIAAIALLAVAFVPQASNAARSVDFVIVPNGWRARVQEPYPGVEVLRMRRGNQRVSVVAIAPNAPVRIVHALASDRFDPGRRTERVTKICRRNQCIAGINGAFFDRGSGIPYSGIISGGELVRSVTSGRPHVGIEGGLTFDQTTPPVQLVTYGRDGLGLSESTETRLDLRGVNRPRGKDGIVAFTPRWGTFAPGRSGRELVLRAVGDPRLTVGAQSIFEISALRKAGGFLRNDEIVLSGIGAGANTLEDLWSRILRGEVERVVSIDVGAAAPTLIGTRPLLIRDGTVLARSGSWFARQRHPRSILASRADGTVLFIVIDGRQKKARGMSLTDAAWFAKSLGAIAAANLDGGGSSAMVVQGRLHSRPPYQREVPTALLVLPA